jgi:DNA/RNA endonuclease YhcR with UshA esterase domain
LNALTGQEVAVEGPVVRIGSTPNGDLTFLNFTPQRGGFTAVIHRSNYDSFPDGFGDYDGRQLRVTGRLEKYRDETPQIRVSVPEQLTIIEPRPTP